jgi:hypothetical protein
MMMMWRSPADSLRKLTIWTPTPNALQWEGK